MQWTTARRARKMNPSVIREILKVTKSRESSALPAPCCRPRPFQSAPLQRRAKKCCEKTQAALQYAASEGYAPVREMVTAMLPWKVDPAQVLITSGSQQGLDLVAKVLIDAGNRVLVETPAYLGALQAKQTADLHSPGFNEHLVAEVMKDGSPDRHVPTIRALYKSQRSAMLAAMTREMPGGAAGQRCPGQHRGQLRRRSPTC